MLTKARGEDKFNNESSNIIQDLMFQFHNFLLKYLNLRKDCLDRAPVYNWVNLYSAPE